MVGAHPFPAVSNSGTDSHKRFGKDYLLLFLGKPNGPAHNFVGGPRVSARLARRKNSRDRSLTLPPKKEEKQKKKFRGGPCSLSVSAFTTENIGIAQQQIITQRQHLLGYAAQTCPSVTPLFQVPVN